jgi:predicted phosphodiesterase
MKTLVIPDIHLKTDRAQRIINYEGADKVIFLGDVFDDFNDTPAQNAKAAEWLNNFVDKSNHVYLISNHDTQYVAPINPQVLCAGFEMGKHVAISKVLRKDIRDKIQYFYLFEDILFTHGGLHKSFIPEHVNILGEFTLDDIVWWLAQESKTANKFLFDRVGSPHWFFGAGYCRGGRLPFGGLTWCDFYREFMHLEGLTQVVGHSIGRTPHIKNKDQFQARQAPRFLDVDGSWSLGLDTNLNHYMVMQGKKVEIKNYADL